jgi:hypothetical protein
MLMVKQWWRVKFRHYLAAKYKLHRLTQCEAGQTEK